jgi:hypothetical protein
MFLWSFFLAPSFLVHMARVNPFLKTPTFVRSGFCQIYPHSVISSNSVKYFIAVESRRICKNLYIFCYCCWAQNWRLSFHLFKAKNYIEFLNLLGIVVRGGYHKKSHQIAVRNFDFLRWFFLPYFFSSRVPRELFFKNYSLFERPENAFTAVKA